MSEIEQVSELEHEFNKLSADSTDIMKMNGYTGDLNIDDGTDSIGNSLDASPSAASASSDNGSTVSSNTGNIIEANVAHIIEDNNKEDAIEDTVIEANVANIIDDNKSDISVESSKHEDVSKPEVKLEEYSYDSVFPSLPNTGTNFTDNNVWNNIDSKLTMSKRYNLTTTQVFHVPVEERRYKDVANSFGNETNKKCSEIADRLGVKVEICCSKDLSLHIVITGTEEKVLDAKRMIVNELQTERDQKIRVPKEHHKFLIGKAGIVLRELQEKTCTSIQVPKSDANSDLITITGPKDGIEQAIHEIQIICDEQSKTGFERLDIPKLYHPWIRGFNNEIANDIAARTGAKINIPPPQIEKDEIAVSGEKEKVELACAEIRRIYESKQKITKLAIQITKSQHKLIIGKNGSTVQEIFKDYDVYVQVPKLESTSETIYLYGEESKLGAALSVVCAKANSIVNIKIEVESWLHRYLIGEKGANISKITADYPGTHVKFEVDNKITLDGPPEEVEKVKERLELIVSGLKSSMICDEITVDPKYYSQIVGKKYDNIMRLNKEHGVNIRVPGAQDTNQSNIIRIEGAPEGVKNAKLEFMELVKKVENERSKDIIIEQKYHSNLIGKNGKNLSEIRAKFNDVQIQIPSQEEKSEVITLRGNKVDVDNCFKYLQKTIKDMQENNYQDTIDIFKQFHRMLIGKQGIFIRKIREETQTRIEVPAEDSDSDSIVIIGRQENVRKARALIEEKVKELVKVEEDFVEIAHSLHTALIGRGGAIIKQIRKECGGVIINFPPETGAGSDKITLKGPRDEIEKAKKELVKLAKQKNEMTYSEDVPAKLEYHRFLVGKNGNNVNTLRDQYNVRIIFPSNTKDSNNNKNVSASPQCQDIITIIGTEQNVKQVRQEIEKTLKNLEEQCQDEVTVDQKWHKSFTAKRAKLINKISDDNCNVKISFPKTDSSVVVLKGPKDAIESAKKQILEIVYELENHVSIEVPILQKYHVSLIGKKGINSSQISEEYKVELQFPAKVNNEENQTNGDHHNENGNDDDSNPETLSKSDIITISGLREDCERAKQALLALVPTSEDFVFPQKYHKHLLENKAEILKDFSNQYNIQINVPKKGNDCDYVTIVGTRENIDQSKSALADKLNEFELNNFQVEITDIKPELIPQLRGRQGVEVIKLEKQFQVRIDFSRKGEPDKVTIKGLHENVKKCESFILKKISDEESKTSQEISVDNRVHSRIIGQKGKAIAKIMEKFKVDVKFSGRNSDVVIVKGSSSEAVDDACDHLKNLEEEYLQDVTEKDQYRHPAHMNQENGHKTNGDSNGFVVSGAPWEAPKKVGKSGRENEAAAPDTANMDLFPTMITATVGGGDSQGQKASWGPRR